MIGRTSRILKGRIHSTRVGPQNGAGRLMVAPSDSSFLGCGASSSGEHEPA